MKTLLFVITIVICGYFNVSAQPIDCAILDANIRWETGEATLNLYVTNIFTTFLKSTYADTGRYG